MRVQRQHPHPLCRRRTPPAWLRPAAQAQPGQRLHSAAGRQVRRRMVLRAPVPRGRRLRRTWSSRLRHGAGSTLGTCTSTARWCRFHACCLRHGANATTACGAGAALVAPVLAAPAVCAPGQLLRCAAPPPAAPVPLGAAMRMGCDGAQRALVLPLHSQGSPAAGGHLKMPSWWPAMAHSCPVLHWGHIQSQCEPLKHFLAL